MIRSAIVIEIAISVNDKFGGAKDSGIKGVSGTGDD
jgi:hypothetical protein